MTAKEIIERIMTQHWDMAACKCWICREGRKAGCSPRDEYLPHKSKEKVEWPEEPEGISECQVSSNAQPGRIERFFWRLFGVTEFGLPNLKEEDYPPMPKVKPVKEDSTEF